MLKAAMEELPLAERDACVQRLKSEVIEVYRWGYKKRKWVWTQLGQVLDLRVPRVRTPSEGVLLIERYTRGDEDFMMNMLLARVDRTFEALILTCICALWYSFRVSAGKMEKIIGGIQPVLENSPTVLGAKLHCPPELFTMPGFMLSVLRARNPHSISA